MQYLIRNVKIYDGTGSEPYVADVLTDGEKIARIETGLTALNVIDGTGLCLSPGFIDAHTHSDSQLFVDPDRAGKLLMGVTAEVNGQCGWSRAPLLSDAPETAKEFIYTVYGKPDRMAYFETFGEQMEGMSAMKLGAHQKCFVGHHMLRASVVGMENRKATPAELDRMCGLMEEAMQSGALGFSTGLVYAPGIFSDTEELTALARVAARYGGIYSTHMRDESFRLEEAVDEAITVARAAGVPLNISHLKAQYPENWYKTEKILETIDRANADGCDITFDVYPYEACSATILSTLPPSYNTHGTAWTTEHLIGKENIETLRKALLEPTEVFENPFRSAGPENLLIVVAAKTPEAEGKTIAEYAGLRGIDTVEAYAEIIAKNECRVSDVRFSMSTDCIAKNYQHPCCMVGTDGLYTSRVKLSHPRHFGTFPRYLGRFVRDMGILPFAEGIRRVTAMPAERYGFVNKGYIREGYDADMVLFDENTLIDRADYLTPLAPNEGIKAVFVMGGIAVKDNLYTNLRNGKIYRR